ncbi:hypothetical protein CDAR_216101 [Caerostris darwini]|uniref:Secreted protein n=1 Tax=Caerostris darwini TaxID=1538125 RepID=A0AAV4SPS4_9ARAC|nr:hypothetical protein CDAR_216101 [Caerostris darwini]
MHPAFLPYLGLWEVLITVSSIGHHYCHGRKIHRFLISSLYFPFGSSNDFKNKRGQDRQWMSRFRFPVIACRSDPQGWGIVKLRR